ncbi:MAG TPA: hypothetical protein DHU63_10385, partial [Candidatus Marinimicrobia bacterium]|nr:hypothetical protein [Candidatus Neomarinimicrobiota bacterium]
VNPAQEKAVSTLLGLSIDAKTMNPNKVDLDRKDSDLPILRGDVELEIFVDGAADLGRKIAGIGAAFFRKGVEIYTLAEFLPNSTNNQAEYTALCRALEIASEFDVKTVRVYGDSELMIRQMNGQYRVRHENMIPLYNRAIKLSRNFQRVQYEHITRNYNKLADKLSKAGMSQQVSPG